MKHYFETKILPKDVNKWVLVKLNQLVPDYLKDSRPPYNVARFDGGSWYDWMGNEVTDVIGWELLDEDDPFGGGVSE